MFKLKDIHVYILNWKKVSNNSLLLYQRIFPIIPNTVIINCDESLILSNDIKHIQLDDSHYYGSQYSKSIKHVKDGAIFCVITGDNIPDNDFKKIFRRALRTFNTYNVGVYAPNDKRSVHNTVYENVKEKLYKVPNTDCGFWFINPFIVSILKNLNYTVSKYGWGIDVITIQESTKHGMMALRDYSISTDQLDHTCGYNHKKAEHDMQLLFNLYNARNF